MAYPALNSAGPWNYRANFHAKATRVHGRGNTFRFSAVADANAITFVGTITALMAAQNTSINKRIGQHNENAAHPLGTRISARVYIRDSGIGVARFLLRNVDAATLDTDLGLLFTGAAGGTPAFTALSAAPTFPKNGVSVASVSAALIVKP